MPLELAEHARTRPDALAWAVAGGRGQSYARLDARSRGLAAALHAAGLREGDVVAALLGNVAEWAEAIWAPLRSGLLVAPLNVHLTARELARLLDAADPAAVIVSAECGALADAALGLSRAQPRLRVAIGPGEGTPLETLVDSGAPAAPERAGARLVYTSGTTGTPKAIRERLPDGDKPPIRLAPLMAQVGIDGDSVVLSPGPAYHSAPFGFTISTQRLGGTALTMSRFDARGCAVACLLEDVTHLHLVPTMLHRLLRSGAARTLARSRTLRAVILGGAPCAVQLKAEAIDVLGPIVHEYYGASEGYGQTYISPQDALAHPGSIGRAVVGEVHVTGPGGEELLAGEAGRVWFSGTPPVTYDGDDARTAAARDDRGWSTVGDVGRLDADGFLTLVGRESQMVISGGVNIHPQEVEDVLISDPDVADAAVFGVPDAEWGERLVAVVAGSAPPERLEQLCRGRLARFKCPREIRVVEAVPRSHAGKVLVDDARRAFAGAQA